MKLIEKPVRKLPDGLPDINDRIEYIRCVLGYPVAAFTRKSGANRGTMVRVLEKEADPSIYLIKSILKVFPIISDQWLYLGTGEPFKVDDIRKYMYGNDTRPGMYDDINERLREIRLDLDMPQPLFAAAIGISKDTLANMETKRNHVTIPIIISCAKKFGISELWFLYGIGNKYKVKKDNNIKTI